jgi:hypothetical protein
LGGYLPLIWQPADTQINLIWIGSAAPVPKQDRRHNGGSVRRYQELFASWLQPLAAAQTRLQYRWPGHQGRIFIHCRSYRERTHLPHIGRHLGGEADRGSRRRG